MCDPKMKQLHINPLKVSLSRIKPPICILTSVAFVPDFDSYDFISYDEPYIIMFHCTPAHNFFLPFVLYLSFLITLAVPIGAISSFFSSIYPIPSGIPFGIRVR